MRKLVLCAFCWAFILVAGCNSKEPQNPGNTGPIMPVPPAQPSGSLLAIQGSCKPTAEDFAAGTVKLLVGPAKGEFTGCQVLPPNTQNMVAFQARGLSGMPGLPALIAVAPAQTGAAECAIAKPTGVNFNPNQKDPAAAILVTKGDKKSGCKIETEYYDAHHWKGKLSATLLPAQGADSQNAKPVPVKAVWDLYY